MVSKLGIVATSQQVHTSLIQQCVISEWVSANAQHKVGRLIILMNSRAVFGQEI